LGREAGIRITFTQADELAARTLAAIDRLTHSHAGEDPHWIADRKRVASDLAGLREHRGCGDPANPRLCMACGREPCPDAHRYADNLRRTAALYGVEADRDRVL
jgi:hypothetical protein